MLEKLKGNLERVTFVLSIVAAALLIPTILSALDGALTEAEVVSLVEYLLLFAACVLLVLPKQSIKVMLPIANAVFYGALAFRHLYSAISGSLPSYATALLYGAVAVLIFIPSCKKAFRLATPVAIAFFLSSALGGGATNLSILLISLLIAANHQFDTEKE